MKDSEKEVKESKPLKAEFRLSTPWESKFDQRGQIASQQNIGAIEFGNDNMDTFIKERTRVHERYILEKNKTKRVALILSTILIGCASLILVFAP